jgi:hypothetical protein
VWHIEAFDSQVRVDKNYCMVSFLAFTVFLQVGNLHGEHQGYHWPTEPWWLNGRVSQVEDGNYKLKKGMHNVFGLPCDSWNVAIDAVMFPLDQRHNIGYKSTMGDCG